MRNEGFLAAIEVGESILFDTFEMSLGWLGKALTVREVSCYPNSTPVGVRKTGTEEKLKPVQKFMADTCQLLL